jgi:hypothetical protein
MNFKHVFAVWRRDPASGRLEMHWDIQPRPGSRVSSDPAFVLAEVPGVEQGADYGDLDPIEEPLSCLAA